MVSCGGSTRSDRAGAGDAKAGGNAGPADKLQKKFNITGKGTNTLEALKDGYEKAIIKALKEILGDSKFTQNESKLGPAFWKPSSIKAKKYFVTRKVVGKKDGGKEVELLIDLDVATINKALTDLNLDSVEPSKVEQPQAATQEEADKKVIEESLDMDSIKKLLGSKQFACWFKASDNFNENQGNIAVGDVNRSILDLGLRIKDAKALAEQAARSLSASNDIGGGTTEIRETFNKLGADIFIYIYGDFSIEKKDVGGGWYIAKGNIGYKVFNASNAELWADENGFFRAAAPVEKDAVTRVIVEVHKNLFPKVLEMSARKAKEPEEYIIQIEGVDEDVMIEDFKRTLKKDTNIAEIKSEKADETVKFKVMYKGTIDDLLDGISYDLKENENFEGMKLIAATGNEITYSIK